MASYIVYMHMWNGWKRTGKRKEEKSKEVQKIFKMSERQRKRERMEWINKERPSV